MTDVESPQPSSRVEREIIEILERADAKPTPVQDLQSAFKEQTASAKALLPHMPSLSASPGIYRIGAALILMIAAAGLSDSFRLGALVLAILGMVSFLSLWFPSRTGGIGGQKRWRGQDLSPPGRWPGRGIDREPGWRFPKWPPR